MADDDVDRRQEFLLPSIEEGTGEALIVNWQVAVGDRIIIGRPMCTVESGGIVRELTSPFVGVVAALGATTGETVAVGEMLVAVADEDAEVTIEAGTTADTAAGPGTETEAKPTRPKHSPLVRRLAEEFEIDLATIEGTGAGGRITRDDVHRAAHPDEPLPGTTQRTSSTPDTDAVAMPEAEAAPKAQALGPPGTLRSLFSVSRRFDAGQLLRAHGLLVSRAGTALSLDALLIKLVQPVMAEFDEFAIEGSENGGIGFSRFGETGVVTDVVVGAETLSIQAVDLRMKDLERSHLGGDEPIVAPLTILDAGGDLGATALTPPLPPGGKGCVAFGNPEQLLQLVNGVPQACSMLTITGTFDEQAIDLARAAAFINKVGSNIEDPILAFAR